MHPLSDEPSKGWDRHAIKAELSRRGLTLTGIAKDAGLYASACRQGLLGVSRPGAEAIAEALDIPFRELFPSNYSRGRHHEVEPSRNVRRNTSAIPAPSSDKSGGRQ